MSPLRITAQQWVERHKRGLAAIVKGQRVVVAYEAASGAPALVDVELDEPDPVSAIVDGRLDAEDLARVMTGYRGQPIPLTRSVRYARAASDAGKSAYILDAETGMVYLLD